MDQEALLWGYFPILVAGIEVLVSIILFWRQRSIKMAFFLALVIGFNGLAVYMLIQMLNNAWPSYTPHLAIILATGFVGWQWHIAKRH